MTVLHVPLLPTVVRTTGALLSFASHTALGELGTPAATCSTKAKTSSSKTPPDGQALLGDRAAVLVRLEEFSHHRHSRNCGALAWCRISALLELDLEGEKTGRQKKTVEGNPESDLPDGGRKPNLGCSPHPRRTAHAGLRRIRANHFPLDEATEIQNLPSAGRPLFAIIATRLPPWISSLSRQSRSSCCTASLIISHERRQIVHVNVTRHPTSTWIAQQLREAFPYESAPSFLLFDHDQKYGLEVPAALRCLQITAVQTSIQSPWQNGVAERWVGSCRRDLLDHIIALERAPPQAASRRVHVLLSRRPHPSRPPQGNSWPQNLFCSNRSGDLPCAIGRFAPSLRPRGLRSVDFHWLTHP
jgi:hypothetical protein